MTDRTPQLSITNTRYGNVLHSTILKIFGDELTYNELEPYTRDKDATSYLEMKTEKNNHIGFMFISVFIDKQKIMEKKYDYSNFSCDMFYHLNQLELEEDSCGEKYADCGVWCEYCDKKWGRYDELLHYICVCCEDDSDIPPLVADDED